MVKKCSVCGKTIVIGQKGTLQMKHPVCFDCIRAAGHKPDAWLGSAQTSPEELKNEIRMRNAGNVDSGLRRRTYNSPAQNNAVHSVGDIFFANEKQRTWCAMNVKRIGGYAQSNVYSFDSVLAYELIEDGVTTIKGGVGAAVAGGVLFGGVGAVVGAATGKKKTSGKCKSLRIKITLNNMNHPVEYIELLERKNVSKNSRYYKKRYAYAQEILSIMQIMTSKNKTPKASHTYSAQPSAADEIRKYKELLDDGIITEAEFNAKKRQLLNL